MEDDESLDFVRSQVAAASITLSVCTGALILGAAGLLHGRHATTHWAARRFLPDLGAIPEDSRVVVDLPFVFGAGVTSGVDAALQVAALAAGEDVHVRSSFTSSTPPHRLFPAEHRKPAPPRFSRQSIQPSSPS